MKTKELNHRILLRVNGREQMLDVDPQETLLDVLRDRLGLTGTKKGCETGECGACTVLLDGKAVNACLVLAVDAKDRRIVTIEGLSSDGQLDPIQNAFIQHGAIQCGYCSPGMILSVKALLSENPGPTDDEIKNAISGNLCRCGSYPKILEAVRSVSGRNR